MQFSQTPSQQPSDNVPYSSKQRHIKRIQRELKDLGVSWWGLHKSETHYLYQLIHPEESIGGVVYGHYNAASIMLVATNRRIILLDTKPLFSKVEDITYDVVAGVTFEWVGIAGTVILHTRLGDIAVRTMNTKAARAFHDFVEQRCIEHAHTENEPFRPDPRYTAM